MRITISRRVCELVERGASPQDACDVMIRMLGERTGGAGGLIALDREGRAGIAFNSAAMPVAIASADGRTASASDASAIAALLRQQP
jgi:isoaspartyl peptidase/L-asparaginase-like protein (Ntn-hydrolase superfamily)